MPNLKLDDKTQRTARTFSELTGKPMDRVLSEAIQMWAEVEGQTFLEWAAAKRTGGQA